MHGTTKQNSFLGLENGGGGLESLWWLYLSSSAILGDYRILGIRGHQRKEKESKEKMEFYDQVIILWMQEAFSF